MADVKLNTELKSYCKEVLGMTPEKYLFRNFIDFYDDSSDLASLYLSDKKPGTFAATSDLICLSNCSFHKGQAQNTLMAYRLQSSMFSRSKKKDWKFIGWASLKPVSLENKKSLSYSAKLARSLLQRLARLMDDSESFCKEFKSLSKYIYSK